MRMREARDLTEFWQLCPPENEMLAMLASIYTTWKPRDASITDEEAHRRSLEQRWAAGAMNAKQLFESMGGAQAIAVRSDGSAAPALPIAAFPGVH